MKLTEAEMRMVFQIESTNQNAALNEIYMTWCYTLSSGVHGFDPQGAGRIPSAGESPHHRGNAGRSQAAIRGAEVIRP